MLKNKKWLLAPIIVVLCIIFYAIFATSAIEKHTWILTSAQQAEPFFIVAHKKGVDLSDDASDLFALSKEIELTLSAENGKLIITDKTNNKTYEGTYKVKSWNRFTRQSYTLVIDGQEGRANISSEFNRTLFISVGNYYLNFEKQ